MLRNNIKKKIKNYNIIKYIGSGSFGTVYLVEKNNINTNENEKFAIKEFLDFSHNRVNYKSMKKEIIIMSSFESEYAVKIFEHFEYNKNYYIVMEYCENGDLSNYISNLKKNKKKNRKTRIMEYYKIYLLCFRRIICL